MLWILHIHTAISKNWQGNAAKEKVYALVLTFLNVPFTPKNVMFHSKDTTDHYNHYYPLSSFSGIYIKKTYIIVWKEFRIFVNYCGTFRGIRRPFVYVVLLQLYNNILCFIKYYWTQEHRGWLSITINLHQRSHLY